MDSAEMPDSPREDQIKACYSTWSGSYYADYYESENAYPPVHIGLVTQVLRSAGAGSVLDAGCGPASILRHLAAAGFEVYGFDLTPEMVTEARRVLNARGVPPERLWEGSVLSAESFEVPGGGGPKAFDAAICIGVLPHVDPDADIQVMKHLHGAVAEGGTVVVEARNQLFALFTHNRYSHGFFMEELIRTEELAARAGPEASRVRRLLSELEKHFRMDLPPVRRGRSGEPGYDEILSRTHNPLVLREQFASAGFRDVRLLFYHYHCLPPLFEASLPELFRRESLAMENPEDWRGHFMASAFLLTGRRA